MVQISTNSIAQPFYLVDGSGGVPVGPTAGIAVTDAGPAYAASGVTAVTGTFSATGQSAAFTPLAGRDFNIKVGTTPGTALAGTVVLERRIDGATWAAVTFIDSTIVSWTSGANTSWSESQNGVSYRLNCTVYSGTTVPYEIRQ